MYVGDKMWVEALRKKLPFDDVAKLSEQLKDEMATKNLEEMDAMFGQSSEECRTFFAQHCDLEKTFTLEHPNWEKKQLRIADVVDHLVNHGTYHRGHISAMLRQMGHKGVSTDYVLYLLR